ncbi:MAG: metal ABC transporter substrate-binding protein [Chloroflexota bacterium]
MLRVSLRLAAALLLVGVVVGGLLASGVMAQTAARLSARPGGQPVAQSGTLRVVTSIGPIADLIQNVGGDRVEVTALVPPGGEPEEYDPTPADATAVGKARVFFANGLGLEAYLERLAESVGDPRLEIVTLSDGLPTITSFGQGADQGGNPHLWLDVQNAVSYVEVIRTTLGRVDPANAATYDANAAAYAAKLTQLDGYIQQQVASLPPEQRVLVTTHDAYPYFAKRYGFQYLAIVSASPGADPSAQEYAQLVQTVKSSRVKAVFGEAGFSDRTIALLASDTGATYVGNLFTDTLGREAPTNTYLGAMQLNADTIVSALK